MLREMVAVCTEVPVKDWVSVLSIGYTALTPLLYLHWALELGTHSSRHTRGSAIPGADKRTSSLQSQENECLCRS